jgi:hypothetical protein
LAYPRDLRATKADGTIQAKNLPSILYQILYNIRDHNKQTKYKLSITLNSQSR